MSMFPSFGQIAGALDIAALPTLRGRQYSSAGGFLSAARLATDPIGTFTLTLTNVVVGSRVNISPVAGGSPFYDDLAAASSVVVPLSVYAPGNPSNDLLIKVRSASGSPTYQPYETQATAVVGAQSIFVSQIPDE